MEDNYKSEINKLKAEVDELKSVDTYHFGEIDKLKQQLKDRDKWIVEARPWMIIHKRKQMEIIPANSLEENIKSEFVDELNKWLERTDHIKSEEVG